jgi:hypothetical protein
MKWSYTLVQPYLRWIIYIDYWLSNICTDVGELKTCIACHYQMSNFKGRGILIAKAAKFRQNWVNISSCSPLTSLRWTDVDELQIATWLSEMKFVNLFIIKRLIFFFFKWIIFNLNVNQPCGIIQSTHLPVLGCPGEHGAVLCIAPETLTFVASKPKWK